MDYEESNMMPKVIHYFWFGGEEKPPLVKKCIASWRKFCPDWEIKEWNETNIDIRRFGFSEDAYRARRWGFVSDPLRFLKVYEEGGVYLDTDVELIAPIDDLLDEAFFACETDEPRTIGPGLGFAAEKGSPVLKEIIGKYEALTFDPACHMVQTCPAIVTEILKRFPNVRCLPTCVFNPKGNCAGEVRLTPETRGIHHYAASWFNWKQRLAYIWYPKVRKWMFLLLGAFSVASLAIGFRNGVLGATDFQWMTAKALLSGVDPYAAEVGGPTFACYAPSCLLLLAPWTVFPAGFARIIWLVANVLFMWGFLAIMCRMFVCPAKRMKWFLCMTVVMCLSLPFRQLLECGQHIGFSLFFFALALLCHRRGSWLMAGLCLIPAAFKYTSMIPLMCVFFMLGCWREIGVAMLGHGLLTLLASILTRTPPWTLIQGSVRIGVTQTGEGIADLASLAVAFGCPIASLWAAIGYVLSLCVLICLCIRFYRISRESGLLVTLALLSTLSCCACYHRFYDFVVLLFVPFLLPHLQRGRWIAVAALGWFFFGFRAFVPFVPFSALIAMSFVCAIVLLVVLWIHAEKLRRDSVLKKLRL